MKQITTFLFLLGCIVSYAQNTTTIYGTVTEPGGKNMTAVAFIKVVGTNINAATDFDTGEYTIEVPANKNITLEYSSINYITQPKTIKAKELKAGKRLEVNIYLTPKTEGVITITDKPNYGDGTKTDLKIIDRLPTLGGGIENALPTFALGTRGASELSSQYSVRGGSYDENLVYVNDFEVYRPLLVRAGEQEGLTFPNIDLMRDLTFSSGGFQAKYGDKMSSVLDITYKRPDSIRSSVSMSLLGGSAHIEGSKLTKVGDSNTKERRFRYLLGARYKTTKYILGSLDVKGEYAPNFYDIQGMMNYDLSDTWQVNLIGNYSSSVYNFKPESLSRTIGLVNFAIQLNTAFEGQEVDDFTTYMTGVSLIHYAKEKDYFLKFLASKYQSKENERFDILGYYLLGQVETNLGSDNVGEIVSVLGVGTQHRFGRNYLTADVTNIAHKGGWEVNKKHKDNDRYKSSHFFEWGTKYQREDIVDELNEWERLDSAGYSIPFAANDVLVQSVVKSNINLSTNRFSAYLQDTWNYRDSSKHDISISYGVRAAYSDLSNEFIITPRAQLAYRPLGLKNDLSFKLAGGLYYQPPFYRELRNFQGDINKDVLAQKSAHAVAGMTWDFKLGNTPFRFITEAYYKYLWDIVPYDVDNVRIRYYGDNNATGYVTGLDMRLNGEFVPGAESWINLSFLRARERFTDTQHFERVPGRPDSVSVVKDVGRPTDQLFTIAIFFQDYLPKNENFKTHLNLVVGTGLPFGVPNSNVEFRNTYRYSPYHRVDIGFSAQLWDKNWAKRDNHPLRFARNVWLSLEIFNLLKVANAGSNTWIKTVYGPQFAIPNYLTSRRVNLKLKAHF